MTTPTAEETGQMTHRQVIKALIGMLLAMMTAMLSSTVVSIALPTIVGDLNGTQNQYTWIVTATLLASTASTPIWGKLSDLFSKKVLIQVSITIFTLGSILAGLAQSTETLIAWRGFQGLGLGGLQALVQIAIAAMVSPRDRGKYMGPLAAVMGVSTIAGPLLGGLIVGSDWLGWRWCFYAGVPLAVIALIVVQRTLHLPVIKRKVSIDYAGAIFIAAGVCDLLIWVSLAGKNFDWDSATSYSLAAIGVALLAIAIVIETKVPEPIIPLRMFLDRTTSLATIASIAVGVAMFGGAVFLGQYFQVARDYSPTKAGLMMLPMMLGSVIGAAGSGQLITRYGRWKRFVVSGAALMAIGFGLMSTIDHATDIELIWAYLAVLGLGMGLLMQNLVLAVQNNVKATDLGAASSTVTFFRSMGGVIGVSVLGAVLATRVTDLVAEGLEKLGGPAAKAAAAGGGEQLDVGTLDGLPDPIALLVRAAYG
ncbi:MAG: MFS transporter, partial [Stackebrandtia sp.]